MIILYNYLIPIVLTIIYIFLFILISLKRIKNLKNNEVLRPIQYFYFIMLFLEILKDSYLITKDGYFMIDSYPIFLNSLVFYTIPLFCFRENKFSNIAKIFTLLISLFELITFIITDINYPISVIQVYNYYFHGSMIAISLYLLIIKSIKFNFKDMVPLFILTSLYIIFAMILSMLLKTDISYFGFNSIYFSFLYNSFGYVIGNLILIIIIFILYFIVYFIINMINSSKQKGANNNV